MDCNTYRIQADADADGELDLVRHLELTAHLGACAACARYAENARQRKSALRDGLPRFTAPPQLPDMIRKALREQGLPFASPVPADPNPARATGRPAVKFLGSATALAASITLALFAGFEMGDARARKDLLIEEAVGDHVRSLQAEHLVDVVSSDRHTVKPWFAGHLDFAPPVADLANSGFPLAGGRLEHFAGRPAAALVFHRRAHAINLFIWPAAAAAIPPRLTGRGSHDGYNTECWSSGSLYFLAVSEIPADELRQFAEAFRAVQADGPR